MPDFAAIAVAQPEQIQVKPSVNLDAHYDYAEAETLGLSKYLKLRRALRAGKLNHLSVEMPMRDARECPDCGGEVLDPNENQCEVCHTRNAPYRPMSPLHSPAPTKSPKPCDNSFERQKRLESEAGRNKPRGWLWLAFSFVYKTSPKNDLTYYQVLLLTTEAAEEQMRDER